MGSNLLLHHNLIYKNAYLLLICQMHDIKSKSRGNELAQIITIHTPLGLSDKGEIIGFAGQ